MTPRPSKTLRVEAQGLHPADDQNCPETDEGTMPYSYSVPAPYMRPQPGAIHDGRQQSLPVALQARRVTFCPSSSIARDLSRLMDCYFYQYIPTEAKTPSPEEINKLQHAAQRCACCHPF